jgi:16S rRNA (guanine966-N2)-methyltransferase
VIVERNRLALRTIRENLERTRLADRAEVIGADVTRMLMGDDKSGGDFDLVLADPPYDAPGDEVDAVLAGLAAGRLATSGWMVALTRPKGAPEPNLPVHWHAARRLSYGDTLVQIFQEA